MEPTEVAIPRDLLEKILASVGPNSVLGEQGAIPINDRCHWLLTTPCGRSFSRTINGGYLLGAAIQMSKTIAGSTLSIGPIEACYRTAIRLSDPCRKHTAAFLSHCE